MAAPAAKRARTEAPWSLRMYEADWYARHWRPQGDVRLTDVENWTHLRLGSLLAAAAGRPNPAPALSLTPEQSAVAFHVLLMSLARYRGRCGGPDPAAVSAAFVSAEVDLLHALAKRGSVDYMHAAGLSEGCKRLETLRMEAPVRERLQVVFGVKPDEVMLAPFEDVLSNVAERRVAFVGGTALFRDEAAAPPGWTLVPLCDVKTLTVERFTARLRRLLDHTHRSPYIDADSGLDPRVYAIISRTRALFTSQRPARAPVVAAAIPLDTALRFAPTCIRSVWDRLVDTGSSTNETRLLVTTFMRRAGVTLEELTERWSTHAQKRGHHKAAENRREVTDLYRNTKLAVPKCQTIVSMRKSGVSCAADVEDLVVCRRACASKCGARFEPSPTWFPLSAFWAAKRAQDNETVYL